MRRFLFLFLIVGVLVAPLSSLASPSPLTPTVILSEIAWSGSSRSDADEWIELANLSDTPFDLSSWSIDGGAGSSALVIPSGIIPARGTFLISNYDRGNAKSVLDIPVQLVTSSVSLSNSALNLVLRDASGVQLDAVIGNIFGTSGSVRASMERFGLDADAWRTSTASSGMIVTGSDFGTPGVMAPPLGDSHTAALVTVTETPADTELPLGDSPAAALVTVAEPIEPVAVIVPTPEPLPDSVIFIHPPITPPGYAEHDIIITEISSLTDEWVEYRNETSVDIPLDGFVIEDASGRKTKLSGVLTQHSYGVTRTSSGTLNNNGDTVRLRDGTGLVLDEVVYDTAGVHAPAPITGTVAARAKISSDSSADFLLTTTPTPNTMNVITAPVAKTAAKTTIITSPAPAIVIRPDPIPVPIATVAPPAVVVETASTKTSAIKLTLGGPTQLYAQQSGLFTATLSGTGSGDARITWLLDDAPAGTGPEIRLTPDIGTHRVHVEATRDGNVVASAERTVKVRALGGDAADTGAVEAKQPRAVSGAQRRSTRPGSGVGVSLGLSGTIIALPPLTGTRKFLLDDGTTVYLTKGSLPALAIGDTVRVFGRRTKDGTTFNVTLAANIRVTGHEPAEPHTLTAADTNEAFLNHLVTVAGTIKYPKGKKFTLSGDSDMSVVWKLGQSLPGGLVQHAAEAEITGILTKSGDAWALLPRGAEDIVITQPAPIQQQPPAFHYPALASMGTNIAIALATLFATLGLRHLAVTLLSKRKPSSIEYEVENSDA